MREFSHRVEVVDCRPSLAALGNGLPWGSRLNWLAHSISLCIEGLHPVLLVSRKSLRKVAGRLWVSNSWLFITDGVRIDVSANFLFLFFTSAGYKSILNVLKLFNSIRLTGSYIVQWLWLNNLRLWQLILLLSHLVTCFLNKSVRVPIPLGYNWKCILVKILQLLFGFDCFFSSVNLIFEEIAKVRIIILFLFEKGVDSIFLVRRLKNWLFSRLKLLSLGQRLGLRDLRLI